MKNKKAFGGIIVLLLMVIMLSVSAFGADELYSYKDFSYTIRDDDTVQIVKYDGTKKSVTVPSKIDGKAVTVIGSHAFSVCSNLENLTIPGSVKDLHECAVSYCPKLKSLTIKEGSLKSLDYMDIYSCRNLKTLSLPKTIRYFVSLYECDEIKSVSINSKNPDYKSYDGVVYSRDLKTLVYYPPGKKDTYFIVPSSVTEIERTAFNNAKNLKGVYVPKTVKEIGETAFGYTSVVIYYEGAKTPDALEPAFYPWKVVHNAAALETPVVKASRTSSSITLKWNMVNGATGYRVYIYNKESKTYETLATVSKNNYKISGLDSNTSHKLAVRAYAKTVSGNLWADEYEKITVRTLPDTPELTVDADKNAVELSWNKVQGATGYVVYYSTTKNGTYKKLATVKGTSCRTEKFNEDDNCYFKIRAYVKVSDSNVYSAYSAPKGIAK